MKRALAALAVLCAGAQPLRAQPRKLVNAKVETRAAAGGLEAAVRALTAAQPQPAWIAWALPAARTHALGCDSWWHDGDASAGGGTLHLEPAAEVMVLLRIDGNRVDRILSLAPDCDVDAGGATLYWLTGADAAASVALLRRLAETDQRLSDSALAAVALHAGAAADTALEEMADSPDPERLRLRAVSRLGWRGRRGFDTLRRLLDSPAAGDRVRERAAGALGQCGQPEAFDLLVALARHDASAGVRREAMSAIARTRDPRAFQFFEDVLAIRK